MFAIAILVIIGSILAAGALVWAFLALMSRVVDFLDANYGGPRDDGWRPNPAGRDPAWWPRFERQFADYVERLG